MAGARGHAGVTVSLRSIMAGDRTWLRSWLPAALHALRPAEDGGRLADDIALEAGGRLVRVVMRDGDAAGVVSARAESPARGQATIEVVCTPVDAARRGTGMEGAAAMEALLVEGGATRIYAPAVERHGISVYFWIRLGYRPLLRSEWPSACDGLIWMARDIDADHSSPG
ncbi:MAG: GNAT family N-acetyltransferase [Chloroflexi bacterium]|nr:GNAT family N-acetyltransferase [Chloroflexota bacterium]